jgi:hypothetical protein
VTDVPDQLLMVVERAESLELTARTRGRALLLPGVEDPAAKGLVGAVVRVVRPDGSAFATRIAAIEMATPNWTRRYPVLLESMLADQPVPSGSQLWLRCSD